MVDFDLIKGRIQKHRLSSIVHNTLELLNEIQRKEDKSYPIWILMALLKWAYLHTTDSILRTPIKSHEFDQLLTLIRDFEIKYNRISFKTSLEVTQSFKIIAYQQFPLQDKFHNSILSRQMVLYLHNQSGFKIHEEFERLTGINLKSFLEYNYFTFFFFNFDTLGKSDICYDGDLFQSYFNLFESKWGESELSKYLDLLSIKNRDDFKGLQKLKTEIMQLYESNIFVTKPLIFFRSKYRIPHRAVFVQTIKHFIYNYLKENSPQFPDAFGKRLERYVELGLAENKIPYLKESFLKKRYSLTKVSDFLIDNDILAEVKAIELHPRSGVMRTKDILVNDLDKSIIKAYIQLIETASKIDPEKEFFGIIITYKEMYLGFGADAWHEFLKEPIEEYCNSNQVTLAMLPPQNLFFINIEDWDFMMQAVKSQNMPLKEILLKAKELNAVESMVEKVSMMEQVLRKHYYEPKVTLSYLKDIHLQLDIIPKKAVPELF